MYMFDVVVNDGSGLKNLLTITGGITYSISYGGTVFSSGVLPATVPMPVDVNGNIKKGLYNVTIDGVLNVFDYQYEPLELSVDVTVNGFTSYIRIYDVTQYGDVLVTGRVLSVDEPNAAHSDQATDFVKTNIYSGKWKYSLTADVKEVFPSNLSVFDRLSTSGYRNVYNITKDNVFEASNRLFSEYREAYKINVAKSDKMENDVVACQAFLNSFYRYVIDNDAINAYACLDSIAKIVGLELTVAPVVPFTIDIDSNVDTYKSKINAQDTPIFIGEMLGSSLHVVNNKIETVNIPIISVAGEYNTVTINGFGNVVKGKNISYQPLSSTLTGLDNVSTNGFIVKNGSSFVTRSIQGLQKIIVENGDGVSGLISVKHQPLQTPINGVNNGVISSMTVDQCGHTTSVTSKPVVEILGYTPENAAKKGEANGYAPLNDNKKIPNQYISVIGNTYKGIWDASTNTPAISNATGSNGDWYSVGVEGYRFGITWFKGDRAVHDGYVWKREPNSNTVTSVFGRTGNIAASGNDYNDFYLRIDSQQSLTDVQKSTAISNLGAKIFSYDSSTDTWVFDGKARFTGHLSSDGNVIAYQGGGVIEDDIMERIRHATTSDYGIVKYDDLTIGLNSSGQLQVKSGFLPPQAGNLGKYLRTNGMSAYWDSAASSFSDISGNPTDNISLAAALGNRLRVDIATQGLTDAQKANGRANLGLGTAATSEESAFAAATHSHTFSEIGDKPTTVSGYGITDAVKCQDATTHPAQTIFGDIIVKGKIYSSDDIIAFSDGTGGGTAPTIPLATYATVGVVKVDPTTMTVDANGMIAVKGDLFNLSNYYDKSASDARFAALSHAHAFSELTGKPTTIAGYGITDAMTTSQISTAIAQAKADIVNSSPAALDTLNELATALGNDPNFATTTATALGNRLRVDISTQGLTDTQRANGRANLGLGMLSAGDAGSLRITTPTGSCDIGSQNTEWFHFQTDRPQFYMDKGLAVDGEIKVYGSNTYLNSFAGAIAGNKLYHEGNINRSDIDLVARNMLSRSYCINVCEGKFLGAPHGYIIKTPIPSSPTTQGGGMHLVKIQGYSYGYALPISLDVVFYQYNGFANYRVVSGGGWNPPITISRRNGLVEINIKRGEYNSQFFVSYYQGQTSETSYFNNWSMNTVNTESEYSPDGEVMVDYDNNYPIISSKTQTLRAADGSVKWTIQLNASHALDFYNASGVLEMRLSQAGKLQTRDDIEAFSNFH